MASQTDAETARTQCPDCGFEVSVADNCPLCGRSLDGTGDAE